jgi:hypothetical protein
LLDGEGEALTPVAIEEAKKGNPGWSDRPKRWLSLDRQGDQDTQFGFLQARGELGNSGEGLGRYFR